MINKLTKIFEILLDEYFPKSNLNNKLKCFIHNYDFKPKKFKIFFKKNFEIEYNGFHLEFCEDPYHDFYIVPEGYLREYSFKEGDIVIDCGAYHGAFTLLASKMVGDTGKVIAFEPDDQNFEKLLHNLKLNNIKNVIPINKGVWSDNKTLEFNNKNMASSSFFFDDEIKTIKVPVVSLDKEINKLNIKKIDFIKADVEGAEIEMIKGSSEILTLNNVNLAIASYHVINGQKTYFDLEKLLDSMNYSSNTDYKLHLTTYAKKSD